MRCGDHSPPRRVEEGNVRFHHAVLLIIVVATTCCAQSYTQRGFLETQGSFYPQKAVNDREHAVGESILRYESFYKPSNSVQVAGALDFRIDTHRQVERDFSL